MSEVQPSGDTKSRNLPSAGDRIRETAKWLTISLAVIGGVLTAGIQLSNIGALEVGSERFLLARDGATYSAIGTAVVLFGAVWTATTPPVKFSTLKSRRYLNDDVLLQGVENLENLKKRYKNALADRTSKVDEYLSYQEKGVNEGYSSSAADEAKRRADAADDRLAYYDALVRNVIEIASYRRLASRWFMSAVIILAGALFAAYGVVIFIWATNPPETATASAASPASLGGTSKGVVRLTPAGQSALREDLGANCIVTGNLTVLLLAKTGMGSDVVIQEKDCQPLRVLVTDEWGSFRE